MLARLTPSIRAVLASSVLVLGAAACGDSGEDTTEGIGLESSLPDETADDGGGEADDSSSGDDGAGGVGMATATVDGTTYAFPDVVECEIDGETWGEGWRSLLAWSADGHDLLNITVGNEESSSLGAGSAISIVIGTQNPNTLDQANPDEEWSYLFGGDSPIAATLAPNGASGTASVGQASGGDPVIAEWSFTC